MSNPEADYLSQDEYRDVRIISVERHRVEKGDTSKAVEGLDELIASQNRGQALSTKVLFKFPGYDSEDRYIHEIPEVRRWFSKLEARYPYLLCLLSNLNHQLLEYVMMFVPYQTAGMRTNLERGSLLRFLKPRLRKAASYGGAVGMDRSSVKLRILKGLGMSESLDDFL